MKVAMIGCGGIGVYHLSHLTTFGDIAQLAGFCDLILEKAEKFAQETGGGAMAYTDFRVMLTEVKPDAVFVCVPPYCHGEIEEELINRNIDFFVEKPLTLDMELAKSSEFHFKASCSGPGYFGIKLLDSNQDFCALVMNEVGSYELDKSVYGLIEGEMYYIQVEFSHGTISYSWSGTYGR